MFQFIIAWRRITNTGQSTRSCWSIRSSRNTRPCRSTCQCGTRRLWNRLKITSWCGSRLNGLRKGLRRLHLASAGSRLILRRFRRALLRASGNHCWCAWPPSRSSKASIFKLSTEESPLSAPRPFRSTHPDHLWVRLYLIQLNPAFLNRINHWNIYIDSLTAI